MKLIVFNGSPRKESSSTKILLDHFINGFSSIEGNTVEVYYLRSVSNREEHIKKFVEAEWIMLGFPLYTDSMPSFVKEFFESLEPYRGKLSNLSIGYLVQSGFPEAAHSRPVERYLVKLTKKINSHYLGTIIKGNGNRIDQRTPFLVKPVFKSFFLLGKIFGQTGKLDEKIVTRLAIPEKLSGFTLFLTRFILKTPLATRFWDKQLKEVGAMKKRYDAPHLKS
jgi:hypothetical protein